MAYVRKTRDVWEVQSNWGGCAGWEVVAYEDSLIEARATLRDYRENQPQVPHRLVKKREVINGNNA